MSYAIQDANQNAPASGVQPNAAEGLPAGLTAQDDEGELIYIALGKLAVHEQNARKEEPDAAGIEQLANLIDSQGLLQNLVVAPYPAPVAGKGKQRSRQFTHGVVAGGRRLRALLCLVKRGRMTVDEQILCRVVPLERALVVSAAENTGREDMGDADRIEAFANMVRSGAEVEAIAHAFGLSPMTVRRRMKLADVSPALFALFRQGGMKLEQLMALALSDDHETQQAAWDAAPAHSRTPRYLRSLIVGDEVSKAVMRYVGIKAYEAAGGVVFRDLFADGNDQPEYIQDAALMRRLASAKLERAAQKLRSAGVPWVEVFTEYSYELRQEFCDPPTVRRAPTKKEAKAIQLLEDKRGKAQEALNALYDSDPEGEATEAKSEAMEADLEKIEEAIGQARGALESLSPEIAQLVGALIYLDHNGKAVIVRDRLRKTDAAAARKAESKQATAEGGATETDSKGGVSERLCNQLTAHRTRALQASLLADERTALAVLVHPMVLSLVYGAYARFESKSAVDINIKDCADQLKTWAPDLEGARSQQLVTEATEAVRAILPTDAKALLPWLLEQPQATLVRLLTLCTALSFNGISGNGSASHTQAVANAVNLRMNEWWTPTKESYLNAVPKAMLAEALKEAGMPDDALALGKLKKAEAVAQAERLLVGKGWVPSVLR